MSIGRKKLAIGDFNTMHQEEDKDGNTIVTLTKYDESKVYKFAVKDLYGEHEEVIWEEVTGEEK